MHTSEESEEKKKKKVRRRHLGGSNDTSNLEGGNVEETSMAGAWRSKGG